MAMTSRERMLTALDNKRPDRLPCQVHGWMDYYLKTYLGGADWYEANRRLGFDYAIYVSPTYRYEPETLEKWQVKTVDLGTDADGTHTHEEVITTPGGCSKQLRISSCWTVTARSLPAPTSVKSPESEKSSATSASSVPIRFHRDRAARGRASARSSAPRRRSCSAWTSRKPCTTSSTQSSPKP